MCQGHLIGQFHTGQVLKCYRYVMMSMRPVSKVTRTGRGGERSGGWIHERGHEAVLPRDQWTALGIPPLLEPPARGQDLPLGGVKDRGIVRGGPRLRRTAKSCQETGWEGKGMFSPEDSGFSGTADGGGVGTQQRSTEVGMGWPGSWLQSWVKETQHHASPWIPTRAGWTGRSWEGSRAGGTRPAWVSPAGSPLQRRSGSWSGWRPSQTLAWKLQESAATEQTWHQRLARAPSNQASHGT